MATAAVVARKGCATSSSGLETVGQTVSRRVSAAVDASAKDAAPAPESAAAAGGEERRCRACRSEALRTDWAAGDRVCTVCGLVDAERLLDDRPEWRDFHEAEDLARSSGGAQSSARSGLVPTDETLYVGGLQPTTLSRIAYGSNGAGRLSTTDRLRSTNHKMDRLMEKMHGRAISQARLAGQARRRKAKRRELGQEDDDNDEDYDDDDHDGVCEAEDSELRPEFEQMLLQEEENANKMQEAMYADKWSLDRALRLFGTASEQLNQDGRATSMEDVENLRKGLDKTLEGAGRDLYTAFSMLSAAARRLSIPDRVQQEATAMLCRYAARRDGLTVRGVSSTLKRKKHGNPPNSAAARMLDQKEKEAARALRKHNKLKQMGSLAAALLFLAARNMGRPRSLEEVCQSVRPFFPPGDGPSPSELFGGQSNQRKSGGDSGASAFIKRKHCSKAMKEVKQTFPDFACQSAAGPGSSPAETADNAATGRKGRLSSGGSGGTTDETAAIVHFTEHTIRRLRLPPVAEACIRTLVIYWRGRNKHQDISKNSNDSKKTVSTNIKLPTLCSAMAYFVCLAGNVMQGLAHQAGAASSPQSKKRRSRSKTVDDLRGDRSSTTKKPRKVSMSLASSHGITTTVPTASTQEEKEEEKKGKDKDDVAFDVFTYPAEVAAAEHREYEMRRMWDAWREQVPWSRTASDVEQATGVSRTVFKEYFKTALHPARGALLRALRTAPIDANSVDGAPRQEVGEEADACSSHHKHLLSDAPMASVLLPHIDVAAPLMKADGGK